VIELTGLRADLPIGAMAAFGVLRLCSAAVPGTKLAWQEGGSSWHTILYPGAEMSREGLVKVLLTEVSRHASVPVWEGRDQIKGVSREEFRKAARDAIEAGERQKSDWLAAFANELVYEEGEVIEPTPFDMSVARQKFLADAVKLAQVLANMKRGKNDKTPAEDFEEALFGPWRYSDDQHSLGWDPSTMKFGAFTYKAPTGMANSGVRAAVWLAFQSLPLFPVFARGSHQQTRAFQQRGRRATFCWPVWEPAITLAELRCLLASADLTSKEGPAELAARRVIAVYRSEKFKPNKYMVTFRPAELAFSAEA
jgi:hypothetical protein